MIQRIKLAFGTVFSGFYSQSTPVAIKQVQIGRVKEEEIKKEVELMIKANAKDHPNILRYIFEEKNDDFMFIATELCRGTLEDYVKGNYDGPTFESEREILFQITQGLAHLHGLGIVHRDIKPTNILIYVPSSNPQVKLADFGRCKVIVDDFTNTSVTNPNGTRGWMAPELYQDQRAGPKVDIFALGLTFGYTLSGGKHPFGDDPDKRSVRIKDKQPMLMARNDLMEPYSSDDETYNLIKSMLVMNPEKRPTVEYIVKSRFFLVGMIPDERQTVEEITNKIFSFQANRQKIFESVRHSMKGKSLFADSIVHLKKLLIHDDSIDVNVKFEYYGYTLLHTLCHHYKSDNLIYLVQLLVKKGADVNTKEEQQGWTPLHSLCYNYNKKDNLIDIVQLLIENGAEVNTKDIDGVTPLHTLCNSNKYAIKGGDNWKRLVSLFEKNGASMHARNKFGMTPNDELILRKNWATREALNALKL